MPVRHLFVRNSYTELHENPTSDFVPDTMLKTCRRTVVVVVVVGEGAWST
jgi:hypothetical protein